MLEILVSREARDDIAEAITDYRASSPILAERFGSELERIYSDPTMYPVVHKNVRRAFLHKFPYSVLYLVLGSMILIVAVIHQSRHESTWKRRT